MAEIFTYTNNLDASVLAAAVVAVCVCASLTDSGIVCSAVHCMPERTGVGDAQFATRLFVPCKRTRLRAAVVAEPLISRFYAFAVVSRRIKPTKDKNTMKIAILFVACAVVSLIVIWALADIGFQVLNYLDLI